MGETSIDLTQRGFARMEFRDIYDTECSLQKSSLADRDAIWLGCDKVLFHLGEYHNQRMHLDQQAVKELLPYLKRFARTGDFLPRRTLRDLWRHRWEAPHA